MIGDAATRIQTPILLGTTECLADANQQAIASASADGLPRLLQYRVGDGLLTVTLNFGNYLFLLEDSLRPSPGAVPEDYQFSIE